MGIAITLGGVDRTVPIDFETVLVSESVGAKANTMAFDYVVMDGDYPRPLAGQEIVFTEGAAREFAGILVTVRELQERPGAYRYRCMARDYTHLFDRRLVVEQYAAQAADLIIKDVISRYCAGFTSANVRAAFSVPEDTYDYEYPSAVVQKLADALEWQWYIDYSKDVHFFAVTQEPAPVAAIDVEADTATYHDLELEEDVAQLKDRVYLKGFRVGSTNTYQRAFTGDGTTKFFLLGYEPTQLADISVTRAGVAQTMKTDVADGRPDENVGGANDSFVCFDNMGMRWNTAPASGDQIVATFKFKYDTVTVVEDAAAQTEMAAREGGDGIHEFVVNDPGLTAPTIDPANARGQIVLVKYAWPMISGAFGSFLRGWRPGQNFALRSTRRFKGRTGAALDLRVYVHSVEKTIVNHPVGGTPLLRYRVGFGDSPYVN